ncbi:MAG: exodeoxyribonuclease V subunit gamma, partial [Gammaproteobacteria bacterium]|nr:exodeoxyribonuclease V subunit gamma [Gammaproteobacteria bacterium]
LPELQRWIQAAGIHWGIDRAHARQLSGAEISGQSWREGIDRLLLGYAATTGMVEPLDGLLPMGDIDGGDADLLARFLAFFDGVAELQGLLAGRRQIASWGQAMVAVLETLVRTDEPDSDGLFGVIGCITQLSDNAALAGLTTEIAFAPWWAALERLLASQPDFGTASGGVRFVPLSAGQIVPARVICLLGLNEESFPRNENRRGYDLMAAAPRRGDRMRNADDRYLFLEALISARETLYLSYQGRRAEDDQPCSPSTVISELLDYLQSSLGLADSRELVTRHPLQPFSPRYYSGDEDSPLFSYVPDYCPVGEPEPVVKSPPGGVEPSTVPGQVSLDQLVAFLKNPARYRLLNVLGIDLRPDERWPQASELLEPDGLDNWRLEQQALRGLQGESGHDVVVARLMASGLLPDTGWGKLLAREAIARVDSISAELIAAGYLEPPEPRPFELLCDVLRLEGALPVRGGCRLIQFHTGRTHGKQLLELWVNHLALSCALGERAETVWVRPGSAVRLSAVSEPQTVLADLLQLYLQGVSRPLHFFPKSASEFVQAWIKDDEPDLIRAHKAAIAAWRGSSMFSGEADDPYYRRAFADHEQCLDLEFEALALRVFRPLLDELGAQL